LKTAGRSERYTLPYGGERGVEMKLAIALEASPHSGVDMETVWEAERLGFAALWCGKAYGTDAVSPVAWVLAQTRTAAIDLP
jgi:alkanesulfonate monooxygenase SsuD/methylene tetrahydromethanopterin reductase-like flavin-dependent oxidoreductase (luciferase family)